MNKLMFSFMLLMMLSCSTSREVSLGKAHYFQAISLGQAGRHLEALSEHRRGCSVGSRASCRVLGVDKEEIDKRISIYQGHTTENYSEINFLIEKEHNLQVLLWDNSKRELVLSQKTIDIFSRDDQNNEIRHIGFSNLKEGYEYRLDFVDEEGKLIDSRLFSTLKKGSSLKIMLASCMDDKFAEVQKKMWRNVWSLDPDVLLLIGDTVYADPVNRQATDPKTMWSKYSNSRKRLDLYRMEKLIPVYASWDDHDYGLNNGGNENPYKVDAKKVFLSFFPKGRGVEQGPGISKRMTKNGQNFIFLDNRSFRDSKGSGRHFGMQQEKWLLSQIEQVNGPVYLISGDQWFGKHHPFESFESHHSENFIELFKKIKKLKKAIVLVSGDRHLSEISVVPSSYLGHRTYEITSSGIHAHVFPGSFKKYPNPKQVAGVDGKYNFMTLELFSYLDGELSIKAMGHGEDGDVLFEKKIKVKR